MHSKFKLFLAALASVVLPAGCAGTAPAVAHPVVEFSLGIPGPGYYNPCVYNRYSVNCYAPSYYYYQDYPYYYPHYRRDNYYRYYNHYRWDGDYRNYHRHH